MQSTEPETWMPIPGYGGIYLASSRGRIWSNKKNRILSTSTAGQMRYLRVGLPLENGSTTSGYVHRLVALAFHGEPKPEQTVVRHLDGDHLNNHPSNLAWGTPAENAADTVRHKRTARFNKFCANGHEWTADNTGWNPARGGFRVCKACAQDHHDRVKAPLVDGKRLCPPEHAHGETLNCRTTHLCACAECMDAMREYRRANSGKRKVAPLIGGTRICPPSHKHGETITCGINHLCKCDECVSAKRAYRERKRKA